MEDDTETLPATPYRLLILGDGSVRTIPLNGTRWVIGRSPECTIPLRDPTVSRRHVLLERQGDSFLFSDLGGSNPLTVGGQAVSRGTLEPGQTLSVGLTRLVLERRNRPAQLVEDASACTVLGREVIDEELPHAAAAGDAGMARSVLERIEWTFADLGCLADAAEPLLDLGLNLTRRRRGVLGRFTPQGGMETLATLDVAGHGRDVWLPAHVLAEALQLGRPLVLRTTERGQPVDRLVLPLGHAPEGVMVLEEPTTGAPHGQELLRLGRVLALVVWHRLQEVRERLRLRDEVQRLRFRGTAGHNALLASTRLHAALQRLRELANRDTPVLLTGEDGTERADLARYLHVESSRAKEPFVAVNLGALPVARYEGELLGDGRGRPGAIARAAGGTVFVDHAHLLPIALQERLAAAIEPARDGAGPGRAHLRLVLAADRTPARSPDGFAPSLAAGCEDEVEIPPLRSEPRDVLALAELFLSDLGPSPDGTPRLLSERCKRRLVEYGWPGNVRQLRHVIDAAAGRAGSQQITPRHLPEELSEPHDLDDQAPVPTLEEVERRHILEVLQRVGGSRTRAAQILGIAASTLHLKLRRWAIDG